MVVLLEKAVLVLACNVIKTNTYVLSRFPRGLLVCEGHRRIVRKGGWVEGETNSGIGGKRESTSWTFSAGGERGSVLKYMFLSLL